MTPQGVIAAAEPLRAILREEFEDGRRTVRFSANLPVPAAVRQNRSTRWRKNNTGGLSPAAHRAQLYNERRGMIRDTLRLYMQIRHIAPFDASARLELSCVIALTPKMGQMGRMIDVLVRLDLDNMIKGLTDALQWRRDPKMGMVDKLLIPNDSQVWQYGECRKLLGPDAFKVTLREV